MTAVPLTLLFASACLLAQQAPNPLQRRYREGEKLVYRMKAENDGRRYEALATGVVKKDPGGAFIEEYTWSNVVWNGVRVDDPAAPVRQVLSLEPGKTPTLSNLTGVAPGLIGPITDMLGFYCDLWLAIRLGTLVRPGDHVYVPNGKPASWADGTRTIFGQSAVDFDLTLTAIDEKAKTATLLVRHVPPKDPQLPFPAPWMSKPVADTPNNWAGVTREGAKYSAAAGKETFDVQLTVSLADGKILAVSMHNPVTAVERDCEDAALSKCGAPHPRNILRRVELSLAP